MGKFQKGNAGKPKGAVNRETREMRAVMQSIVDYVGEPETLRDILDRVKESNPAVLLNFIARIAPKDVSMIPPTVDARDTPLGRWLKDFGHSDADIQRWHTPEAVTVDAGKRAFTA